MSRTKQKTDVIVIGGGVIGLTVADSLAREGLCVALIDRGQCGAESSWAAAGIIQSGSWHRQDSLVQLQRDSVRMYDTFAADLRERTGIDPEFIRCGSLEILIEDQQFRMARSEAKAARTYERAYGRPVLELLTSEQACAKEPAVTPDSLGAKYSSTTGQVRSPRLLKALYQACLRGNVEIVEGCEVGRLLTQQGRVIGVQTAQGPREAGTVVLAAGCWSNTLDEHLAIAMPVMPVRGQVVLLHRPTPPFSHVIERGRCYLVPRRDGHIIVGATQEPEAGFDKSLTLGGISGLLSIALRLIPGLADSRLVTSWAGLRPGTPDGRPYLGPVPGLPGLIAATGHFRCGLTLAPITAQIVTSLIVRGSTPQDLSRCRPGRQYDEPQAASAPAKPALPTA